MHLSNNLDPDVNYVELKESILTIPNYYHHLKMSSILREDKTSEEKAENAEGSENAEGAKDKTNGEINSVHMKSNPKSGSWINYSW